MRTILRPMVMGNVNEMAKLMGNDEIPVAMTGPQTMPEESSKLDRIVLPA